MEASNLNTLSRHITILLLCTDCQAGGIAAIARYVSFAQITCYDSDNDKVLRCF